MLTRYGVWLNGLGLQDIAESVYITDIKEQATKQQTVTMDRQDGRGTISMAIERQSLTVIVRFAIREYDTRARKDVCSRIRAWAQEGYMTISDRPGQRLYVICSKAPTIESALKWTSEMEVSFTAYDCPWWEAVKPSIVRCPSPSASATLMYTGDVDSPLDVSVTASEPVDAVTIVAGGQVMQFASLGMAPGNELNITHDKRGLLAVTMQGVHAMSKRTADSADDISISPGETRLSFDADGDCSAIFSVRRRFL